MKIKKQTNKTKAELRKEYCEYISSEKWKAFRLSIINERGRKCENCGITNVIIHAHHTTYVRFKNEIPEDIKLLCVPCHENEHDYKKKYKRKPKKNTSISSKPSKQELTKKLRIKISKIEKRYINGKITRTQMLAQQKNIVSWYNGQFKRYGYK